VQIGTPGSTGTAHIQDIRFTVGQRLPGAIIVQVNLAGASPGDVSISNSPITIGGLRSTEIDCPADSQACRAAYLGLHLTSSSSAYIDNVWAWVADHPSDPQRDPSEQGVHMAVKGGVLVEATKGTWLVGIGSEHFWLYQLAYNSAQNVFVSLFQSETNYQQGNNANTQPPSPYTSRSLVDSDPDFSWCAADGKGEPCYKSIAQWFPKNQSGNIRSYASASWNFPQYGDQDYMNVVASTPSNSHFYGLTAGPDVTRLLRLADGSSTGGPNHFSGSWQLLAAEWSP
jgi:hypothetical protein